MPPTLLATPQARIVSANPASANVVALQAQIDRLQSRPVVASSSKGRQNKKVSPRGQHRLENGGARSRRSTGGRPEHIMMSATEGGMEEAVTSEGVGSMSTEVTSLASSPRRPHVTNGVGLPPRQPQKHPQKSPTSSSLPPSQQQQRRRRSSQVSKASRTSESSDDFHMGVQRRRSSQVSKASRTSESSDDFHRGVQRRRSSQVSKGSRTSDASDELQRGVNAVGDSEKPKPITFMDSDVKMKAQRLEDREDTSIICRRSVVSERSDKRDQKTKYNLHKHQQGGGRGTPPQARRRVSDDGHRRDRRRRSSEGRLRRASAPPICEGESGNDDLDTSLSSGGRPKLTRRVSFYTVEVREYETILGDHPCVGSGPPLSIGWKFHSYGQFELDGYEIKSGVYNKPPPKPGMKSREEREHILMGKLGYTQNAVAQAVREVNKEKMRRRTTHNNLPYMAFEETFESIMRRLRKIPQIMFGKSDDPVSKAIEAAKAARLSQFGDVASASPQAKAW